MNMPRHTTTILLILITFAGLGFRLTYNKETVTNIQADARQYTFYAYNLYKHGVYSSQEQSGTPESDAFRSPGYPLFLYAAMVVSGTKGFYATARTWQAIISGLLIPLVFILGIRLNSSKGVALSAAALTAASPHLLSLASYILTETLSAFFILLSLLLFVETLNRRSYFWGIGTGLCTGCLYMINEIFLFFPFLLGILSVLIFLRQNNLNWKTSFKAYSPTIRLVSLILVIFIIFPIGWSLRNSISVHSPTLLGKQRALNTLVHGTYPDFVYKDPAYKYFPYREDPQAAEFGSSMKNFRRIFWERASQRPVKYLIWYTVQKPYYVWSWNILQGMGDVYIYPVSVSLFTKSRLANSMRGFMKFLHPFILAATLLGFIFLFSQFRKGTTHFNDIGAAYLFLTIAYATVIYSVFASWPRYSIPFRPELYLAASWTAAIILEKARQKLGGAQTR